MRIAVYSPNNFESEVELGEGQFKVKPEFYEGEPNARCGYIEILDDSGKVIDRYTLAVTVPRPGRPSKLKLVGRTKVVGAAPPVAEEETPAETPATKETKKP